MGVTQLIGLARRGASALAIAAAVLVLPVPSALAATEFPAGYRGYHTYAETVAELDAAVAAHPSIVRKFSIGRSYLGRQIWAAKISDNVNTNEYEPEVLFDGLAHGREHLTVEMGLYILHLLTDNYGSNARITRIVNTRETFIVFMLNPDGGEYDIASGEFRKWRKNRQPAPNSTAIGTDLNRNFGYRWGCCDGSSGDPEEETYRGPYAWSTPELAAYRDFVLGRQRNGEQQITINVSWHSSGKYILWPYGYTKVDVPATMTVDDHRAFVALARGAASRNGYTAQQASDLYITDGVSHDWMYREQGVFSFVFELGPGGKVDFYPTADRIARLTSANRGAVLYLLEQADCPWRAAGLAGVHCTSTTAAVMTYAVSPFFSRLGLGVD